jgi:cobalt transporter subunit CbtA
MIFTRIIYSAVGIGLLTGLLLSLMQIVSVDPIIFAAEGFEVEAPASAPEGHEGHSHDHSGWAPADGVERTFYTVLSNISAAIGFAAVMLALMNLFAVLGQAGFKPVHSLLWGLAGFAALYLAPGIGLPPEIPGIEAAPTEHRQAWWLLTVASVATGLGILALTPLRYKAICILFFAIPYLVGAPHPQGPLFVHPDPAAVTALMELHQRFIVSSGIVNLLFWIALGLACGYAFNRWFRPVLMANESANEHAA